MSEFPIDVPLREGDLIQGKYRVTRMLGVGGMGFVVEAYHEHLGQRVALKGLLPAINKSQEAVARFVREARAAVRIQNEHVSRVMDVGTLPDGTPFMVMEYLDGADLAQVVRAGPLAIEDAVDYVLQACEAIAEAHAMGIVHRDLKPSNLFLTRRSDGTGLVKVLDFGISKVSSAGEPKDITGTTVAMGSPQYMSPEQMRSAKHVDMRADIWALGAVLFELVAARPAFDADTFAGLCAIIATEPPAKLTSLRPEAPVSLEEVVERCLEKDVAQRYANVAEVATALVPFASRKGRASAERVVGTLQTAGMTASALVLPDSSHSPPIARTAGAWTNTGITPRTRGLPKTLYIVGAVALLGIVVLTAKLVVGHADPEPAGLQNGVATPSADSAEPIGSADPPGLEVESLPIADALDAGADADSGARREAPASATRSTPARASVDKSAAKSSAATVVANPPQPVKPGKVEPAAASTAPDLPDYGGRQ